MHPSLYSAIQSKIASGELILPTLPEVAIEVVKAFDHPSFSAGKVATILTKDPAISARVLKMANSAFLASNTQVKDLKQAVVRIGLAQIRNVVTAIALEQLFVAKDPNIRKSMKEIRDFGVKVASASMAIHTCSKHSGSFPVDNLMMLSLLSTIGFLPILKEADSESIEVSTGSISEDLVKRLTIMILNAWDFNFYIDDIQSFFAKEQYNGTPHPVDYVFAGVCYVLYTSKINCTENSFMAELNSYVQSNKDKYVALIESDAGFKDDQFIRLYEGFLEVFK